MYSPIDTKVCSCLLSLCCLEPHEQGSRIGHTNQTTQDNKPAALPRPRRQSALSSQNQSQTRQSETKLCWDVQLQSSLLATLSPELRVMIWEQVLGGMRIHIIQRADRRMGHVACPASEACDICRGGLPPSSCKESRPHIPSSSLLALPLACKQM